MDSTPMNKHMKTSTPKRIGTTLAAALLLAGAAASAPAMAQHRFHGGPRIGVYIGAPLLAYSLYRPYYYAPYYYPAYYPPVVVAPSAPPTYVEQVPPQQSQAYPQSQPYPQSQAPAAAWYYCAESQAYYPYVKQCPAGWQQVAPQTPG